ncbi:hypothetical protein [Streptomyces virginiae]|uniref:hypothetical protein n=1 Tax=Streptomyces virginiae TaxID=1961 RepID=UPI002259BC22|nr:hypothetical protein [Streptomyces virginiae]MCX5275395.1 hypothetical protein [Streptomyces virginiae]
MATQKALAGAMRWGRGAVIALCAALALLVHHETAAVAVTSAPSATHTGHAMPGMASSTAGAMPQGSAADHTDVLGASPSAHSFPHSACASLGMQHCTTASIEVVKLPVPPQEHAGLSTNPHQANARPVSAAAIGRAPPDLSVLSQLRI